MPPTVSGDRADISVLITDGAGPSGRRNGSMRTDSDVRAALLHYLEHGAEDPSTHDIYADDAVLEFPQSGERFVGKRNFLEWRAQYPAEVAFSLREIRGGGDLWISEATVTYDGGSPMYGVAVFELHDGRIVRETIYGGEPWPAPEWRAPWRAAEVAS